MPNDDSSVTRVATSEPTPAARRSDGFRRCLWLGFLVLSLAYAWYSFYAPGDGIAWADDYATAQRRSAESDKPVILFFTGDWCSPCQIMKRQVWADDQVATAVNEGFIPVTIDVDDDDAGEVLSRYAVNSTPVTIITDPRGNVLEERRGRIGRADFLGMIGTLDPPGLEQPYQDQSP